LNKDEGKWFLNTKNCQNFEIRNSGDVIICGHATTAYITNREGLACPAIEKNGFQLSDGLPDPNLSPGCKAEKKEFDSLVINCNNSINHILMYGAWHLPGCGFGLLLAGCRRTRDPRFVDVGT
jgi:hypothetical protein